MNDPRYLLVLARMTRREIAGMVGRRMARLNQLESANACAIRRLFIFELLPWSSPVSDATPGLTTVKPSSYPTAHMNSKDKHWTCWI